MTALARLSFWVPAARLGDFEGVYRKKLLPLLEKHGLAESAEYGRPTVEGVFSRLFAVEGPTQITLNKETLRRDPVWQQALSKAAASLGTSSPGLPLQYRFGPYRLPSGPGKSMEVGSGLRQGLWQSFGVHDGLPLATIPAILQDHHGDLWFASDGNGVCRYDGAQATTFTVEDGLLSNTVSCMAEDRAGNLWFGTGRGIISYDGQTFTSHPLEGSAPVSTLALLCDRTGNLWFGTGGWGSEGAGLRRYNSSSECPKSLSNIYFAVFELFFIHAVEGHHRQTDPQGISSGSFHIMRGGGFSGHAGSARSAFRNGFSPGVRGGITGARLLRMGPAPTSITPQSWGEVKGESR